MLKLTKITVLAVLVAAIFTSNAYAETLKSTYFPQNKSNVVEVVKDGQKTYLIQASFSNGTPPNIAYQHKRLNALTRFTLLKFLQVKYPQSTDFKLSQLQQVEQARSGNDYIKISKILASNITPISHPQKSTQTIAKVNIVPSEVNEVSNLNVQDIRAEISKQVLDLELATKRPKSSIDDWKNLYDLYFLQGDIDGANHAMDKVIEMESVNE